MLVGLNPGPVSFDLARQGMEHRVLARGDHGVCRDLGLFGAFRIEGSLIAFCIIFIVPLRYIHHFKGLHYPLIPSTWSPGDCFPKAQFRRLVAKSKKEEI